MCGSSKPAVRMGEYTDSQWWSSTHLGRLLTDTVAFVVDMSQLLLQVELDPVVKANDGSPSSRLSDKDMLKSRRVRPGRSQKTGSCVLNVPPSLTSFINANHSFSSKFTSCRCGARFHPPARSSPCIKFKPDPVQLLLELSLILGREVLLHQVFMRYLQKALFKHYFCWITITCSGTIMKWGTGSKPLPDVL